MGILFATLFAFKLPIHSPSSAIIESIPTSSITVWFAASTAKDKGRLQQIIRSAEKAIGCDLPSHPDLSHSSFFSQTSPLHHTDYIQLPIKQCNLLVDLPHFQLVVSNFCTQVPLVQRPHIFMVNLKKRQECQLNSDLPSQCEGIKSELTFLIPSSSREREAPGSGGRGRGPAGFA